MARIQVEVQESKDRIQPRKEGVPVNVTNIEFVTLDNADATTQTRVTVTETEKDAAGNNREFTFNLLNPFSGDEKYRGNNIGRFLMLFQSLSDTNIKEAEDALGGYEDNHDALHKSFVGYLSDNYRQIPCNILLCYPINKDGDVNKYMNIPTVGNYINSPKREKDLLWNDTYMSLTPGAGNGATPETRGATNAPVVARKRDF